ncbi:hypothetical protein [uncultured Anaerococcus sp.]|nr:hypothetical protein [uncultured Anaerococcus sp.]
MKKIIILIITSMFIIHSINYTYANEDEENYTIYPLTDIKNLDS